MNLFTKSAVKHQQSIKQNQNGMAHLAVVMACLVIVAVFAIGWTVSKRQKPADDNKVPTAVQPDNTKSADKPAVEGRWVEKPGGPDSRWSYEGSTPPKCPEPILAASPTDISKATAVLLPGQYRGTHYKAHGGMRFDNSASADIQVKLPFDSKLTGLKRYIEGGELQYLLSFEHPCGYMIRFDHLAALSDEFNTIAATTPEASEDTRSNPTPELFGQKFKAGTLVAKGVGAPKANNIGFDFGVYDLRQTNEISKNATWADLHRNESAQTFYGICWLPLLPKSDTETVLALLSGLPKAYKYASDYCPMAPGGSTLQYNGGRAI